MNIVTDRSVSSSTTKEPYFLPRLLRFLRPVASTGFSSSCWALADGFRLRLEVLRVAGFPSVSVIICGDMGSSSVVEQAFSIGSASSEATLVVAGTAAGTTVGTAAGTTVGIAAGTTAGTTAGMTAALAEAFGRIGDIVLSGTGFVTVTGGLGDTVLNGTAVVTLVGAIERVGISTLRGAGAVVVTATWGKVEVNLEVAGAL